jgi:5-hydroxyisourate hydrolase
MEQTMPGISLHVVDVARGRTAAGMRVEVYCIAPVPRRVAEGELRDDGTLGHPIVSETLPAGTYEALFHVGAYFAGAALGLSDPPFLDVVPFRFNIADPARHYHLPMKVTPWGFSLWRGA